MTAVAVTSRISQALGAAMPAQLPRLEWDRAQVCAHQRDALRAQLAHAIGRSPFHAERLRGIDPARFELDDLAALPVMTKAELMGAFDDVVTDRRLTRAAVEAQLAENAEGAPRLLLDDYVCLASGGSSGERGVFVQTAAEYGAFGAGCVRRSFARMIAAGGPPPGGLLMASVGAAAAVHSTGFAAAMATAPPVRVVNAPATLPIPELVDRLNAIDPPALMGYPAKLAELARERLAGRLRIAPLTVTATSEMLTAEDREAIEAGFGVPVVDQFASTEGLIGHTEPGGAVHTFASDLCIAELVGDDGRPVAPGETSARVLVTNLHNRTQPLIRYELTDRFTEVPGDDAQGHLRAAVEGRADDVFRYGPVEVHPLVFRTVMVKHAEVTEYAVRQTPDGADVDVVLAGRGDPDAIAAGLRESLASAGVPGADVRVRAVDAIPRHPQTGKARRFAAL